MDIFITALIVSNIWLTIFLLALPTKEKKEAEPFYKFIGDIYEP